VTGLSVRVGSAGRDVPVHPSLIIDNRSDESTAYPPRTLVATSEERCTRTGSRGGYGTIKRRQRDIIVSVLYKHTRARIYDAHKPDDLADDAAARGRCSFRRSFEAALAVLYSARIYVHARTGIVSVRVYTRGRLGRETSTGWWTCTYNTDRGAVAHRQAVY
jgi:hypothetical protein